MLPLPRQMMVRYIALFDKAMNQNFNKLLRQYIPKGKKPRALTDNEIERVLNRLKEHQENTLISNSPTAFEEYCRAA